MFKQFSSLANLVTALPDEKSCIRHFRAIRWPNGIVCPHCGTIGGHYTLKDETHKCGEKNCHKKFSVRNGTIFEESRIPLKKWFLAIYLATSHKKGISSCQLARDIEVTQKTAWFVLHRINEAASSEQFNEPLEGTIEMDETYVGGKEKFKHASKRIPRHIASAPSTGKITVFGMIQRGGNLRMQKIENTRKTTLMPIIHANVAGGSTVYSDEAQCYKWMRQSYEHNLVAHSLGEYVREDVYTNSIEGVFSHFKRSIIGIYHHASDKHIDRYLGVFAWRWNRRTMKEGERMNKLLHSTQNRRLTYAELIAKGA